MSLVDLDEGKIKAWSVFINKVLLGIAAIVAAYKAPMAISDFSVNLRTEQIVNNTLRNVTSI